MIRRLDRAALRHGAVVPLTTEPPSQSDRMDADEILHRRVCRLLAAQMAVSPDNLRTLVDDVLARFAGAAAVTVRTHPDDQDVLAAPFVLAARHRLAGPPELIADATLTRGGCVVHADRGTVDATIEARVRRALAGGAST